ncbi:hypothetical protein C1M51_02760 [Methylibium sp. Pch-M]|uniref:hypothetical protein n=1 Tax=Methylibium sp. Pch-M TaxID=2082386 RepID=UPI001011942F|nr:hypothetical protein [Methylibium sp. Pch-M]QAZ38426.1 hypothetical protein C1M51_02760 [Methylibium sp. Pch-M]
MPKIPIIQSELSPGFQRTGGGDVTPINLDGLTQGAFRALDSVERRDAEQARLAEQARQLAERQAQDEANVSVSNTMSLAHANWAERLAQQQQDAPAGAAGFTASTMKDFDAWRDETEKSVPERGRKLFRLQSDSFRTQIHGRALSFETQARQAKLETDWEAGLDDDRRAVWADPSQYQDALARRAVTADSLNLPPAVKDKLVSKARDALTYTAAMGLVRNDPADVLRRLGYGYAPPESPQQDGEWVIPADVQAERDAERMRILKQEQSDPSFDDGTRAAVGREIARLEAQMAARPPARRPPPLKTERVDLAKDPVFSNLSPERLDTITNHALTLVRQQEAGARAATAAAQAEGLKLARGVMSAWDNGYAQDPAIVSAAKRAVQGTPAEIDLLTAEARFGEAQRFRLMSPAQQAEYLSVTRPQATTPDAAVLHEKLTGIKASADAEIKRDAFTYGAKLLNLQPAEVDWSSPQAVAQTLPARVQQAAVISAKLGKEVAPITVQEAEAWGTRIEALPPLQRAQNIAEMTEALGAPASVALARTIREKNVPLALAIAMGSDGTTSGRFASELVLRGQQALKDKTVKVEGGAEVGWRAQITREIGDAYPNEDQRRDMIEAAYLANIGMAAEGGFDPARAVRMITGGLTERGGAKVPLPRGVSADDFDKQIRSATSANVLNLPQGDADQAKRAAVYVRGNAVPMADFLQALPDARLVYVSQGRYSVQAGGAMVLNAQGQRVIVRFP